MIIRPKWSTFIPYWTLFFFNDTATTEIYTLSLHDALPIYRVGIGNIADFYVLTANAVGCNAATPGEDGTSIVGRNGYERRLYDADIRAAECGVELGVKKVAPGVVVFENDVGIPSDNGGSDVTRG